jgi:hypothetical protein
MQIAVRLMPFARNLQGIIVICEERNGVLS